MEPSVYEKKSLLAKHYYGMGRYGKAEKIYKEILADEPDDPKCRYYYAHCLEKQGEKKEALDIFLQMAGDEGSMNIVAKAHLAEIYANEKNFTEAEKILLEVLSQCPDNAVFHAVYADILVSDGRPEEARAQVKIAKAIDPNSKSVIDSEHYLEAKYGTSLAKEQEMLEKVMNSSMDESEKLYSMALTEYYRKQYRKAHKLVRQAYLLDPMNQSIIKMDAVLKKINRPQGVLRRVLGSVHMKIIVAALAIGMIIALLIDGEEVSSSAIRRTAVILVVVVVALIRYMKKRKR